MEEILEGEKYKLFNSNREVEVLAVKKGYVMYRDKNQWPLVSSVSAFIKAINKTGLL